MKYLIHSDYIGNKPRLLRVSVKSESTKWKIVKASSRLNKEKENKRSITWINPDYIKEEREENKKLRQELFERKKIDKNLMIRTDRHGKQYINAQPATENGVEGNGQA